MTTEARQVGRPTPGGVRVQHLETSGTFSLDGGTWDVDNNVWVIGDDDECVVIDAPHDAAPILAAIGERRLTAILLTHAHDDHVTVVPELLDAHPRAKVALHPDDEVLWTKSHPDLTPSVWLHDGAAGIRNRSGNFHVRPDPLQERLRIKRDHHAVLDEKQALLAQGDPLLDSRR